ncbi:MAG: hypothetical protein KDM91_07210 [Verrucomicrobiae bacterium]|nr:hypothetical protein [Verrucomicrobiae bacterium]MCP5539873.1 hypothetical protein [Akkermansiaceae bacterium]
MLSGTRSLSPALLVLAIVMAQAAAFGEDKPKKYPEDSPEHQALTAASPFLGKEDFTLRSDYWRGAVTTRTGTAMRLQFFKGNEYSLFFGAATGPLPKDSRLRIHVFDPREKEVASAKGEPGQAAAVLTFKAKKTDLYLILLRIEPAGAADPEVTVPAVMIYGWE